MSFARVAENWISVFSSPILLDWGEMEADVMATGSKSAVVSVYWPESRLSVYLSAVISIG